MFSCMWQVQANIFLHHDRKLDFIPEMIKDPNFFLKYFYIGRFNFSNKNWSVFFFFFQSYQYEFVEQTNTNINDQICV